MLHDLQKGLADVSLYNALTPMLDAVEAAHGSKERRLGVYRTNTLNSLSDVLASAYPVVERIVGPRFFRALAEAFIAAHPPQQPVLYRYGGDMADFLQSFEPTQELPYLADVARLEWARIESYFAADIAPLDPQRFAEVPPVRLGEVAFTLHPSAGLISAAFPVFEIWSVNQPDHETVPEIDFSVHENGLIFRRDHLVTQRVLGPGAFAWLESLKHGHALGEATEQASALDGNFDLQNTLRQHLADGIFTDITG